MTEPRQHGRALVVVAAIVLSTISAAAAAAAPTGRPAGQNVTPLTQLAQNDFYGGYTYGPGWGWGYDYKPACPYNYHYTCWYDPYGYRHCGCVLNSW